MGVFFSGHVLRIFVMRGGPTADTVIHGTVEGLILFALRETRTISTFRLDISLLRLLFYFVAPFNHSYEDVSWYV